MDLRSYIHTSCEKEGTATQYTEYRGIAVRWETETVMKMKVMKMWRMEFEGKTSGGGGERTRVSKG